MGAIEDDSEEYWEELEDAARVSPTPEWQNILWSVLYEDVPVAAWHQYFLLRRICYV